MRTGLLGKILAFLYFFSDSYRKFSDNDQEYSFHALSVFLSIVWIQIETGHVFYRTGLPNLVRIFFLSFVSDETLSNRSLSGLILTSNQMISTRTCRWYRVHWNVWTKSYVIKSGAFGRGFVPEVHALVHLEAIFVFCGNKSYHQHWARERTKIRGVHTNYVILEWRKRSNLKNLLLSLHTCPNWHRWKRISSSHSLSSVQWMIERRISRIITRIRGIRMHRI